MKIVLFSPVRTSSAILREVLLALDALELEELDMEMWFYDHDSDDADMSQVLSDFIERDPARRRRLPDLDLRPLRYERNDYTHVWKPKNVTRVTEVKNYAIETFLETDADRLFLLDADIIIHPRTIAHLAAQDVPAISEVNWTVFVPGTCYLPNLWDVMSYEHRSAESVLRLRTPGVYPVGALAMCTMLKREPLQRGLSFAPIHNLDFWGEDRYFGVRAAVLGIEMFGDTHYPAYHVYRADQIKEAARWRAQGCPPEFFLEWLDDEWEACIRRRLEPETVTSSAWKRGLRGVRRRLGSVRNRASARRKGE